MDFHVFIPCHDVVEVEILCVQVHEPGIWCADDAVEEEFCGDEVCCWGASVVVIGEEIAADSDACAMCLLFLGTNGSDDICICDNAAVWDGVLGDEVNGVGALDAVWETLGEAADFIAHGVKPYVPGRGCGSNELFVVLLESSGWVEDMVE